MQSKSEVEVLNATPARPRLPVTVIIPVRNEAHNLPRCMEALKEVGEVYVIDSGSTDDTEAIARSYNFTIAAGGRRSANGPWIRCHLLTIGFFFWMRTKF